MNPARRGSQLSAARPALLQAGAPSSAIEQCLTAEVAYARSDAQIVRVSSSLRTGLMSSTYVTSRIPTRT